MFKKILDDWDKDNMIKRSRSKGFDVEEFLIRDLYLRNKKLLKGETNE